MTQILVIEDDSNVRTLILKLLRAEGFDVIGAADGDAGIQSAQIYEPDLIICDIMMPGCGGYEVLEHLRQDPATAMIPFIFLSAKAERTDLRQGMDLGADDYLTKPFKRNELLGAISGRLAKQAAITQPYIDEMKRAAQTLSNLAYRDPLTNLPNRIVLHHQLQEALKQAKGHRPSEQMEVEPQPIVALLHLNLDRFKAINTNLGYAKGDLLLQQVAERLDRAFGQLHTVARLGGDEFSLLMSNITSKQAIADLAQSVLRLLSEPYNVDGDYAQMQTSMGIALYPDDGSIPDLLFSKADTAMRYAKTSMNGKYQFYAAEMDAEAADRLQIENNLDLALDRLEFQLYYQPQVNLITRRIIGAEALLRWHHPELGMVYPGRFISVAEETGLIVPIGQWVLETACMQAKAWQTTSHLPLRVSVNLSARQFREKNLVETVANVLQQSGLPPDLLVLELTETSVMEDVEATILTLQELKSMGVQISIDDFGTGYSSLNYLKRFPIDTLKIDKSFVQEVTTDTNDAAIAKAIIAMAQSLKLKVIAEGVETEEQFNFLRQCGCHAMQGYIFGYPMPAEDLEQLLLTDQRLEIGSDLM